MTLARARRFIACLPAAAWLAAAAPPASGVEVLVRSGIQAVPTVRLAPLAAPVGAWTGQKLVSSLSLAASLLAPQPLVKPSPVPAVPPAIVSPVVNPKTESLPAAHSLIEGIGSFVHGFAHAQKGGASQEAAELKTLFDGEKRTAAAAEPTASALRASRPDYQPHDSTPLALLPDGRAIPPESYSGGYHGSDVDPEKVQQTGGFPARGPVEDWRLREHTESMSQPVSAFRGSTPYPTSPDGEAGAALWAGEDGWVYDVSGVPTWNVESQLHGRVQRADGSYRGSLMSEHESAFPAQTPLECIRRWGRVSTSVSGKLFVRPGDWAANPRFDPAVCSKFWGSAPAQSGS